jgi:hypothetical protein
MHWSFSVKTRRQERYLQAAEEERIILKGSAECNWKVLHEFLRLSVANGKPL